MGFRRAENWVTFSQNRVTKNKFFGKVLPRNKMGFRAAQTPIKRLRKSPSAHHLTVTVQNLDVKSAFLGDENGVLFVQFLHKILSKFYVINLQIYRKFGNLSKIVIFYPFLGPFLGPGPSGGPPGTAKFEISHSTILWWRFRNGSLLGSRTPIFGPRGGGVQKYLPKNDKIKNFIIFLTCFYEIYVP
jgi:hypothetical protein